MFWPYLALAYLAGALSAGLLILLVLCLMAAGARRQEALETLRTPRFGP